MTTDRRQGLRALTQPIADAIVSAVARGVPMATAARAAGVSERQLRQWLAIGSGHTDRWADGSPVAPSTRLQLVDFAERVGQAVALCEQEHVGRIEAASRTPDARGRIDWRASAWILNNHPLYRGEFHEFREVSVEHGGDVSISVAHRLAGAMSDEELLAAVQPPALPAPGNG